MSNIFVSLHGNVNNIWGGNIEKVLYMLIGLALSPMIVLMILYRVVTTILFLRRNIGNISVHIKRSNDNNIESTFERRRYLISSLYDLVYFLHKFVCIKIPCNGITILPDVINQILFAQYIPPTWKSIEKYNNESSSNVDKNDRKKVLVFVNGILSTHRQVQDFTQDVRNMVTTHSVLHIHNPSCGSLIDLISSGLANGGCMTHDCEMQLNTLHKLFDRFPDKEEYAIWCHSQATITMTNVILVLSSDKRYIKQLERTKLITTGSPLSNVYFNRRLCNLVKAGRLKGWNNIGLAYDPIAISTSLGFGSRCIVEPEAWGHDLYDYFDVIKKHDLLK